MENFVARLKDELTSSLHAIENGCKTNDEKTHEAIPLLEDALERLRAFICDYEFKDKQEEIDFFRIHKPSLLCYLLYYRKMYDIEINRPQGGSKVQQQYLRKEQGEISAFFFRNREFYKYYRSGDTHFDSYYFLRNKPQKSMAADNFSHDPEFSSGGDYLVAQVLANDMLDTYLMMELEKLDNKTGSAKTGLMWTISKTDLVEVSFPVYLAGAFNGGKLTQKDYKAGIEKAFNIELGNLSRMLYDLKNRKNPTQFLDKLKKLLLDYLDNNLK